MNQIKVAVDFGSGKITVAVGEQDQDGIRIISYNEAPSSGIKDGEIVNTGKVGQILQQLINKAQADIGMKIDEASVNISARSLRSRDQICKQNRPLPTQRIDDSELDEITSGQYNLKEEDGISIFEAVPQSYNVDDTIGLSRDEVIGMDGSNIEVRYKIISGKAETVERRRSIFEECNIKMTKAILSPIASARAVLTGPELENGSVLVDIGAGTTEVAIIKENTVREVATIPFGGNCITSDVKEEASVSTQWAERIKVEYGCCCEEFVPENKKLILKGNENIVEGEVEMTLLSRIIEARLSEILDAVRYIIDNSAYSGHLPGGVILTGGVCYTENILQLAKAILGRKVRLAAPCGNITNNSVDEAFDAYSSTVTGVILESFNPVLSHPKDNGVPVVKESRENQPQVQNLFGSYEDPVKNEVFKTEKKAPKREKTPDENKPKKKKSSAKDDNNGFFGSLFGAIENIFDDKNNIG